MSNQTTLESIESLFEACCKEQFESLNCKAHDVVPSDADFERLNAEPTALIDAGSNDLELVVALQIPLSVLAMTYPLQDSISNASEEILEDWLSELSTRLIGRLKSKLLKHNCTVTLGLPQKYFGLSINELLPEGGSKHYLFYAIDGEICACNLSVEIFNDNVSFTEEENQELNLSAEGDLEFF